MADEEKVSKAGWWWAVAGLAGAATALYFRNSISDGVKKLRGEMTSTEETNMALDRLKGDVPDEFLGPDTGNPDVGLDIDSVHTPNSAEKEMVLRSLKKETEKEAEH